MDAGPAAATRIFNSSGEILKLAPSEAGISANEAGRDHMHKYDPRCDRLKERVGSFYPLLHPMIRLEEILILNCILLQIYNGKLTCRCF